MDVRIFGSPSCHHRQGFIYECPWGAILEFPRKIFVCDSWLCPLLNMSVKKRQKNKFVCESFSSGLENIKVPSTSWCRPMYPECVAFLRKAMRVREIVVLVRLSHSHGFAQKRNAFRIHWTHGTAPKVTQLHMGSRGADLGQTSGTVFSKR